MKRLLAWIVSAALPLCAVAAEQTLTLDQCVEIALKRNNELVQSKLQLKMFARDEITALSRFLPSVNGSMGYNHSVLGPSSQFRVDPRTGIPVPLQPFEVMSWTSSAGFSGQQMFFDGSSIFNFSRAAYLKKSAAASTENTRQSVIFKVKEAYFNLLKKEKLLQAQEETLKQWDESHKRYDMMYQVGKVPKSDVLKAKVQLENARLALIQAQNDMDIASATLNHVLGFPMDQKVAAVDNMDTPPMEIPFETALAKALAVNPLLNKGKTDVSASKAGIASSSSTFLPSVYGYGGYSWRNEKFDQIKNMWDTDYNWYLGVSLSVPIFQGFSRVAEVSRARLEYQSAKETLEQTKRDIALQVKQAYAAVQLAKQQMTATHDAEAAAEEDLRLNKEKYDLGSGTMLELITAQAAYTKARNDRIQAMYDYRTAQAQLEMAMGVLR